VTNIKKENFLQVSNASLFQEMKSVVRYRVKFREFVSVLSSTVTRATTSENDLKGACKAEGKGSLVLG